MRWAVYLMVSAGLALGACGSPDAEQAASATGPAPLKIGEIELKGTVRALGNEPFWHVELAPGGITYGRVDEEPVTGAGVQPAVTGNLAVWETTLSDGRPIKVTLTGTDCSDGMSDRIYPLAAMVNLGEETLQGCAATVEALERASESGRVE